MYIYIYICVQKLLKHIILTIKAKQQHLRLACARASESAQAPHRALHPGKHAAASVGRTRSTCISCAAASRKKCHVLLTGLSGA